MINNYSKNNLIIKLICKNKEILKLYYLYKLIIKRGTKMSNTNYVILTVASVDFSYRETMARLMSSYSKDLIDNAGAKGTRFGSIGTGDHAGSLIFIQFYDDLTGYQKALEIQSKSSVFKEIMDSGKANIYLRNISTSLPTKFEQSSEHPKYIVLTRAEAAISNTKINFLIV